MAVPKALEASLTEEIERIIRQILPQAPGMSEFPFEYGRVYLEEQKWYHVTFKRTFAEAPAVLISDEVRTGWFSPKRYAVPAVKISIPKVEVLGVSVPTVTVPTVAVPSSPAISIPTIEVPRAPTINIPGARARQAASRSLCSFSYSWGSRTLSQTVVSTHRLRRKTLSAPLHTFLLTIILVFHITHQQRALSCRTSF